MKHAKRKGPSDRTLRIVFVAFGVVALTTATAMALRLRGSDKLAYEANAVIGSADNMAEVLAQMQEMVDRSMITMSINASPVLTLSDKGAGVNWQIENPEEQSTKLIRVEIFRDDTNEMIYKTGAILPGTYITGTLPDTSLDEGTYDCTAYFYSYDIDTREYLGMAGAQIILTVLP